MFVTPQISSSITVQAKRGNTIVTTYIPGETLTVSFANLPNDNGMHCYDTTGATFFNDGTIGCNSKRSCKQSDADATIIMPASGSVTVIGGWNSLGKNNPVQ